MISKNTSKSSPLEFFENLIFHIRPRKYLVGLSVKQFSVISFFFTIEKHMKIQKNVAIKEKMKTIRYIVIVTKFQF